MNLSKIKLPKITFKVIHNGIEFNRELTSLRYPNDGIDIISSYHAGSHFKLNYNGRIAPYLEQYTYVSLKSYEMVKEVLDANYAMLYNYYHQQMYTRERWTQRRLDRLLRKSTTIKEKVRKI